ncbi:MAG: sensor histidine kinase [Nocardioidaceae bacterium]
MGVQWRRPWALARSVRARTTLAAAVVVSVALLAAAIALILTLESALQRSGDGAAETRAYDIAALARIGALPRTLTSPSEDDFVQVVSSSGEVVAATSGHLNRPPVVSFAATGDDPTIENVTVRDTDGDLEDFRVSAVQATSTQGPLTIYVATNLEEVAEATTTLQRLLLLGLPPVLALIAFSTWVMIGRALRPVESIRTEVDDISSLALDRRVPVPDTRDEIEGLARTMNAMLDRLQVASERQRAFVDDASHELQTPLASFRSQLEVALAGSATTDWPAVAAAVLADGRQMEGLVSDLLFLARADGRPVPVPQTPVDLDDIVLEEVVRLRTSTHVRVDSTRVSAAPVRGSQDSLTRMVRNLLENAEQHAATVILVELSPVEGSAQLVVEDDGPGVDPAQRVQIFDRFFRADEARSRRSGGAGLGLSIVKTIVDQHHGDVWAAEGRSGHGARFMVRIPLLPMQPDSPEAGRPEADSQHQSQG